MLEADLRRCGQRVHGLAGRDAQLRPPEIADELQDPLVHLSSGGERHLPLLPQTPPPRRAARYPHVRCHHVDGCHRGERHLPLLPQTPPPGPPAPYPHIRFHPVDGCHPGADHLPLLPQSPHQAAPPATLTFVVITWMAVIAGSATTCRSSPRPPPRPRPLAA